MRAIHKTPMYAGDGESADKAFWISFADLMLALMMLFLMIMGVALLTVSSSVTKSSPGKDQDQVHVSSGQSEAAVLERIATLVSNSPGVHFDAVRKTIDFGERARFSTGSHHIDLQSERFLRGFVPRLLQEATASSIAAGNPIVIRRVVVEGFADKRGDYLYNLNLSLQRAQRVMCALLDDADTGTALTAGQRKTVRETFVVGGFSFNRQLESLEASRRVELRLELGEAEKSDVYAQEDVVGHCRISPSNKTGVYL